MRPRWKPRQWWTLGIAVLALSMIAAGALVLENLLLVVVGFALILVAIWLDPGHH